MQIFREYFAIPKAVRFANSIEVRKKYEPANHEVFVLRKFVKDSYCGEIKFRKVDLLWYIFNPSFTLQIEYSQMLATETTQAIKEGNILKLRTGHI
ncbi:MAG: hypothetical protein HY063_10045 [Bacteroidetes bacterium]|nr:hypothetical protein [Bacteroidota bacterium]